MIASTLPASAPVPERVNTQVRIDGMQYAQLVKPLEDITGAPAGELRILQSYEGTGRRISALGMQILSMWLLAVLLGLGTTYLLARRIVGLHPPRA